VPDQSRAQVNPEPQPCPSMTTEEIFRQAIVQQATANQQAIAAITQRNDEVFDKLKEQTNAHLTQRSLIGLQAVSYAASLDAAFQQRVVSDALTILRDHGILPQENQDDDREDADEPSATGTAATDAA